MLSFGGQGANQAIEDAGALRCLFDHSNDATGAGMTQAFEQFDTVRRKRAARAQTLSKVPAWHEEEVTEELMQYADPPGSAVPMSFAERTRHDYG